MITDRQVKFRLAVLAFAGAVVVGVVLAIPDRSDMGDLAVMLGGGAFGIGLALLGQMIWCDRKYRDPDA